MRFIRKAAMIGASGLAGLVGLGWLGLQVPPRNFAPPAYRTPELERIDMPAGLPEPVQRFARAAMGRSLPRLNSALLWGQARFKLGGLWSQMRFKAHYRPGVHFNRYMEITWFGWPILHGRDTYREGRGHLEISGLVSKQFSGASLDQAQCLAMWAESVWLPAALITAPQVRWEAVDQHTARLLLPCPPSGQESLRWQFEPVSGLPAQIWGRRFRGEEPYRTPWRIELGGWQTFHGMAIPTTASARWEDEPAPYGIFIVQGVEYNL